MVLRGYLSIEGDGLGLSTRAMMSQISILNIHTDNIANFGVAGYQRKDPVVTSFVEYLGPDAIDKATSTEIGRIRKSGNSLDFALNTKGYFQKINGYGGLELTRDGRFRVDRDGYLRALDQKHILGADGLPIRFPLIPQNLDKDIKVAPNGDITIYDPKSGQMVSAGQLAVVSQDGTVADEIDVKQGYVEDSNVFLQQEYAKIVPLRRQFEANRQLFIIQSDALSRMIQELGRAQ